MTVAKRLPPGQLDRQLAELVQRRLDDEHVTLSELARRGRTQATNVSRALRGRIGASPRLFERWLNLLGYEVVVSTRRIPGFVAPPVRNWSIASDRRPRTWGATDVDLDVEDEGEGEEEP
jgi:hypothetical protein